MTDDDGRSTTIDERMEQVTATLATLTADLTRMRLMLDDVLVGIAQLTRIAACEEKRLEQIEGTEDEIMTIAEAEQQLIMNGLALYRNNKTKTAQALGITVKTIQNKLKEYAVQS